MGTATLIVYSCSPLQAWPFLDVIEACNMSEDTQTLTLGMPYISGDDEPPGVAEAFASVGGAAAPDAVWKAWEVPHGEELGRLVQHVPELGFFKSGCDKEGNLLVTADEVRAAVAGGRDAMSGLLGTRWTEVIEALSKDSAVTVRPTFAVLWEQDYVTVVGAAESGLDSLGLSGAPRQTGEVNSAAIDQFLTAHGFTRTQPWSAPGPYSQRHTEVCRTPVGQPSVTAQTLGQVHTQAAGPRHDVQAAGQWRGPRA